MKDAAYTKGPVRVTGGGSRWRVVWSEDGSQHERTATTLERARVICDEQAVRIGGGQRNNAGVTVADVVGAWLDPVTRPGWRPGTRATARTLLEVHVVQRWGQVAAGKLTRQQVAQLAPEMNEAGYAFNTINSTLKNTRAVVRFGAGEGVWQSDGLLAALAMPDGIRADDVDDAIREGSKFPVPTRAQAAAFIEAHTAKHPPYGLMARLTLDCGGRFGEVTALQVEDIDRRTQSVMISKAYSETNGVLRLDAPKTRKGVRRVPFSDETAADLDSYLLDHDDRTKLLFHTMRGIPRPVRRSNFRARFTEPARAISGFPKHLTWHSLRHAAISRWIDEGNTLANVSLMAGHASVKFTLDNYYGASADYLADAHMLRRAGAGADTIDGDEYDPEG
ncbi:tyrosine-type recombinase/integrase [Gemmatimonas sp.]|uniref:tyrosine-type recombinase/integrase n=1 Tax=Gemmatimonas sp. TaxID=1962908 RepID=UPI0035627B34